MKKGQIKVPPSRRPKRVWDLRLWVKSNSAECRVNTELATPFLSIFKHFCLFEFVSDFGLRVSDFGPTALLRLRLKSGGVGCFVAIPG
jgi:hypothetical protein